MPPPVDEDHYAPMRSFDSASAASGPSISLFVDDNQLDSVELDAGVTDSTGYASNLERNRNFSVMFGVDKMNTDASFTALNELDDIYIANVFASYNSPLKWRLWEEWYLFRKQWWQIFASWVVLFYGTQYVFLNLAFYRYTPGDRLQDLGHQLIPRVDEDMTNMTDMPMYLMYVICFLMVFMTFYDNTDDNNKNIIKRNSKPYFANLTRRFGVCYAVGHTLRACSYLSTTMPGSAKHCLPGHVLHKPTLAECFYKPASVTRNCGDLMFSGHMLLTLLFVLMIHRYGGKCFNISRTQHYFLITLALLIAISQSFTILAVRHHYSSDIVVAWYVTPLMWYYYCTKTHPVDLQPDLLFIANSISKRQDSLDELQLASQQQQQQVRAVL